MVLENEKEKGNYPTGISVEDIGQFSERSLSVLKQFRNIANTKSWCVPRKIGSAT